MSYSTGAKMPGGWTGGYTDIKNKSPEPVYLMDYFNLARHYMSWLKSINIHILIPINKLYIEGLDLKEIVDHSLNNGVIKFKYIIHKMHLFVSDKWHCENCRDIIFTNHLEQFSDPSVAYTEHYMRNLPKLSRDMVRRSIHMRTKHVKTT